MVRGRLMGMSRWRMGMKVEVCLHRGLMDFLWILKTAMVTNRATMSQKSSASEVKRASARFYFRDSRTRTGEERGLNVGLSASTTTARYCKLGRESCKPQALSRYGLAVRPWSFCH